MEELTISLFGRLDVRYQEQVVAGLDATKVQELLCYVLLFRSRPHPRDVLAELLWGDRVSGEPKKYLRKTLWQLHMALAPLTEALGLPLVHTDGAWIQYNSDIDCWLDVDVFERAFFRCEGTHGEAMMVEDVEVLQNAVALYTADLLDGWYQDWSLYERERYQFMYLTMLEKLTAYHEVCQEYEVGVRYGIELLRCEPTHERTHRRMMRLYNLMGNRAAALRQYHQCAKVLRKELGVAPNQRTELLYNQVRCGGAAPDSLPTKNEISVHELYRRLKQLEATLADSHRQVAVYIQTVESQLQCNP